MLIAILSDSHDNMENIKKALELTKARGISEGLHLGDMCAPPAAILLAESGLKWHCVWGNVDGDKLQTYRKTAEYGTMEYAEQDFAEIELGGKKIFITHYPEVARIAALSGRYDAAFHGHNHVAAQEMVGESLLANPGEVAGFRFGKPSFGIYDTETGNFEHVSLL